MISDGIAFNQFPNPPLPNLGQSFPPETRPDLLGVHFVDLGGDRPKVKAYLSQLRRSFTFAIQTAFVSLVIAMFGIIDLMRSTVNANLLHPAIDFLLGFTAVCLAIVAVVSCYTSINYFKKTINEICQTSIS